MFHDIIFKERTLFNFDGDLRTSYVTSLSDNCCKFFSSGAVLFGYDGTTDTLKGVNLNCLGVSRGTSASPSFGLSRGNITGYYLDSSNSNVLTTDQGGYSTNSNATSEQTFTSGNLHIGAIFNVNKISGSGVTKSLEFNLFYQISRLTLT